MSEDIPLLDNVRIAAPCPANWNEMVGGDRVRYCRSCEKNVYNLSEMSQNDAEKLLKTHEGHLCVRYYRRADGKIITNNCPVGLRTIRKVYLKTAASAAALCGLVFGAMASMGTRRQEPEHTTGAMAAPSWVDAAAPFPQANTPEREHMMGGISAPPHVTMGEVSAPPHVTMGTPEFHQPPQAPRAAPVADVSDNTDEDDADDKDDDDTGF